jgi:GTP-binding protein Era
LSEADAPPTEIARTDVRDLVRAHGAAAWEQSESALRHALSQQLTVAFLGSASAGKDSAIRALFGIDFGEISPIPGSTARIRVAPLDEAGKILLVNAPGFGDVRAEVDQKARAVLDSLDIVVYVVNCEGGATIDEKNDLAKVRERGRPVLVVLNKIDLIRPNERSAFVMATLAQLDVDPKDAVVAAFDPLPQLSEEPIGIGGVIEWIQRQLQESGKDLLFAKHLRNKAAACEAIIQAAARRASVAGAVPIPGADLAAVTAIQVKLIRDCAEVFEVPVDKEVALFIIGEVLSGSMRGFVRWGVEALKAAGWIPGTQIAEAAILGLGAVVAGATTYGVGRAAVAFFQSGRKVDGDTLRQVFDAAAWEYKRRRDSAPT